MEKQISHFKILEEIGSGGMGVVYRARDQRLRRKVALKVLPAGVLAEPMIRERLMREAQTTSSLNHPHIVTVFEIHSAGDRDFIAMEFVEGQSLDRVITAEEGLPVERALRYAIQIADGLACAHEHGVIHRDLKPQNVMITPNDEVKILDFGLAKRFLPAAGSDSSIEPGLVTLTAPGVKVGTPAYMSPEQIESRKIDARSDVFSFGSLLYQMLTGVIPFQRRNAILIFKAVLSDQPQPVRALKPQLPHELEHLLVRALEKSPEDRYQNMRDLLAELEEVHGQLFGTGIYPARSGFIPAQPPPRPSARRFLAAAAVLALLVAGLGWWLMNRFSGPPRLSGHHRMTTSESSHRQAGRTPENGQPPDSMPPSFFARWVARSPVFSPDGRSVVYFQPEVGPLGSLWIVAEEGGAPRRLLEKSFRGGDPAWTPDGRWIVFWADLSGEINLWCVPASGGEAEPLTHGAGRHTRPEISADGRHLLYTTSHPDFVLARRSPDGGAARRLYEDRFEIVRPEVSPAGDRIAFSLPDGKDVHLFVIDVDGGEPRQVTTGSGERNIMPRWSADGGRLYYYQERPAHSLREVPAAGGDSRTVLENWSWGVRYDTAVGPSDARVVYTPIEAGVPQSLTVRDLGSGEEKTLGLALLGPRWSPDGHQILGSDEDDRIHLCPAVAGECRFIAEGFAPRWGRQGGTITFARRDGLPRDRTQKVSIWTLKLDGLVGHQLAEVDAVGFLPFSYGLTADGASIQARERHCATSDARSRCA